MKFSNKKKIILGSIIGILIGTLVSVSYAFFTYANTGTNSSLVTGNIYMRYKETKELTLEDAMPSDTYDSTQKFEFTIEGANTTTDKDVWYEIKVKHGTIPTANPAKSESDRIPDRFIKYKLVKEENNVEEVVVDGDSWEGLTTGKTIYVDKIEKNSQSTNHKYTLYMWISNKLEIGNSPTANFSIENWNKAFASIKVDVNEDFTEKTLDEPYMTVNAMNTFPSVITDQKANIKEVYFNKMDETTMNTRYNAATIKADLTYNNEGKVLAWLETNTIDSTKYNLIVASDGETYFPTNSSGLLQNFSNATIINFNNINTSRVTNMQGMFFNDSSITRLDLSGFNTNSVQNMGNMFQGCSGLTYINLSNLDTNDVTNMMSMFQGCSALTSIDLSNLNTNSVTAMQGLFSGCSNLMSVNLSGLGSSSLSNIADIFQNCTSLTSIDMSNFNFGTAYVAGTAIFGGNSSLVSVNLSNADISRVTGNGLDGMFSGCTSLTTIDLSFVDTSQITSAYSLFSNSSRLQKIYVSSDWDISNLTASANMFSGCTSLEGGNGTHYSDDNPKDKTMAIIDGTNGQPGYLTDIALKPNN